MGFLCFVVYLVHVRVRASHGSHVVRVFWELIDLACSTLVLEMRPKEAKADTIILPSNARMRSLSKQSSKACGPLLNTETALLSLIGKSVSGLSLIAIQDYSAVLNNKMK